MTCMRLLLTVVLLIPLLAQEPQRGSKHQPPAPKNLKVLKIQPSELIPTMRAFSHALGVECNFCHVQGNFASDEKPEKETARKMIVMAEHINSNFTDGKVHVTCYTCHRGDKEPKTAPPAASSPGS